MTEPVPQQIDDEELDATVGGAAATEYGLIASLTSYSAVNALHNLKLNFKKSASPSVPTLIGNPAPPKVSN